MLVALPPAWWRSSQASGRRWATVRCHKAAPWTACGRSHAAALTAVAKKAVIDKAAVGQPRFIGYGAHGDGGRHARPAGGEDTRTPPGTAFTRCPEQQRRLSGRLLGSADGEMNGQTPARSAQAAISYLSEQTASDAWIRALVF